MQKGGFTPRNYFRISCLSDYYQIDPSKEEKIIHSELDIERITLEGTKQYQLILKNPNFSKYKLYEKEINPTTF